MIEWPENMLNRQAVHAIDMDQCRNEPLAIHLELTINNGRLHLDNRPQRLDGQP